MSFTDFLALNSLANNYYKGLNCMAWWAKGDFLKLNRAVINSTVPDVLKVQLVELGIQDSQERWHSYFHSAADVTLFISSLGLFPEVGMGPRGSMLKFRTPPAAASLSKTQLRSISSLESQITKHEEKLAEYIKDPLKFDNKGFLKNALNEAVRQRIIRSRINHLEREIKTFQNNIQKIINGH